MVDWFRRWKISCFNKSKKWFWDSFGPSWIEE